MKSLFSEFKNLLEQENTFNIEAFRDEKIDLVIDGEGEGSFTIQGSEQYRFRDLLWRAGIIFPDNEGDIQKSIAETVAHSFNDNRQLALALDTSLLLQNHVNRFVKQVQKEYQRQFTITRLPILLVAQATQYELHHMASSERKSGGYPKDFILPVKIYNSRGRRGKFGAFMLQTLMDRYPLIIAKPGFPMLMLKPEGEVAAQYANISPTSPVFDFLIVEQFTQLSKVTNMEILFLTTDSNLSKVAAQSGLKAAYLSHGEPINRKEGLRSREMVWILIHLLWTHDYISVNGEKYCMTKYSNGKGANLYFKKSNGKRDVFELDVNDRVF